jgi:hypothetical protein
MGREGAHAFHFFILIFFFACPRSSFRSAHLSSRMLLCSGTQSTRAAHALAATWTSAA